MPVKFDADAFVNRTYSGLGRGKAVAVNTANTVGKVQAWISGMGSGLVAVITAIVAMRVLYVNFNRRDDPTRPPLVLAGYLTLGTMVLAACAAYQIWTARSDSAYATYSRRMSGARTTASAAGDVWNAFLD